MPRKIHHRETEWYNQEAASLPAGVAVVPGTLDSDVKLPTAADVAVTGFTKYAGSATAGDPVEIVTEGCVEVYVKAAGTAIVRNDYLSVHGTSGYLKKSAMTNTLHICAQALEDVNADDVMISVRIVRMVMPAA